MRQQDGVNQDYHRQNQNSWSSYYGRNDLDFYPSLDCTVFLLGLVQSDTTSLNFTFYICKRRIAISTC